MTSEASTPARSWARSWSVLNPLKAVWWLFSNVRFAIFLLFLLAAVSLAGVLLPQKPLPVRGDTVAEAEWLEVQEGRFGGAVTDALDGLGLFDIFHARWFATLLAITVISTAVYIASRLPATWRTMTRPRTRVPDRYFEMAANRASVEETVDPGRLESLLRSRRYSVRRETEGDVTYLFGDRFQWAALGNLLTHAAVVVFIVAAVVSRADAFSSPLFLAEGGILPVFPVSNPNQIQVELVDSVARFSPDGIPLDYRSEMVIYRRGEEVKRCVSTVNSPCSYDGYRFYQTAYFGFGAAVTVKDAETGNVLYRETAVLSEQAEAPRLRVEDASGNLLYDEATVLPDAARAGDRAYAAALLELAGGRVLTVWRPLGDGAGEDIIVFEPGEGGGAPVRLSPGDSSESAGLTVSYLSMERVPAGVVEGLPVPDVESGAARRDVYLQMSNAVYGTGRTSDGPGTAMAVGTGPVLLTATGLGAAAVQLKPGESVTIGGLEYTFDGQREFSGIIARRDRSDYLVWLGAGMIVAGLMITFWVPRRRLWARITGASAFLAGQAPGHANYSRELEKLLDAAREPAAGAADRRERRNTRIQEKV